MFVRRHTSITQTAAHSGHTAVTIGNFDGVHLGHQALLKQLTAQAAARGLLPTVLSFTPHPKEFFAQQNSNIPAPARVFTLRDKAAALAAQGVAQLVVMPFNAKLARMGAEDFVRNVLLRQLGARLVLVGDDFRFGAQRLGDFALLQRMGRQHGFEVQALSAVYAPTLLFESAQGEKAITSSPLSQSARPAPRASSSLLRQVLAVGNMYAVQQLLGQPYAISGHVIHGQKLGRTLGYPTLNLAFKHPKPAASGIFAVRVHGLAATPLPGVASLGTRPTVEDAGLVLLETHVFDWQGHAYGKLVRVELLHKIRDEAKFDCLNSLENAIKEDALCAVAYFENGHSL